MGYENRSIAFLDILGFSDFVTKNRSYEDTFEQIRNLLETVRNIQERDRNPRAWDADYESLPTGAKEGLKKLHEQSIRRNRMTSFSDCIAISAPADQKGIRDVLTTVNSFAVLMLKNGLLIRGGITVGELYHEGDVVFGPGLIEAHYLESKVAHYPRIIVTKIAHELLTSPGLQAGAETVVLDADGALFVDLLGLSVTDKATAFQQKKWLNEIGKALRPAAANAMKLSEGINSKHQWFVNYFNKTAKAVLERESAAENA